MSAQQIFEDTVARIASLYDDSLFTRGGQRCPVRVFLPQPQQVDDPDSLLGPAPSLEEPAREFAQYNHAYLQSLQNSGRRVFNGVTFAFQRLRPAPLRLEAFLGRYFDMLATCAALDDEMQAAARRRGTRLPGRTQYHRQHPAEEAALNGTGRSAAIGGAALIVCPVDGEYRAILARRSSDTALDAGRYHLLPAFIFQPARMNYDPLEWSVRYHVLRELAEELFGAPEPGPETHPSAVLAHPGLQGWAAMEARGLASLHLTGIAFNYLTLRPEICALLLVRDAEWWPRLHDPQSAARIDVQAETDGKLTLVPIHSDQALRAALPPDLHLHMPPQAFAALWLGVDLARERLGMA